MAGSSAGSGGAASVAGTRWERASPAKRSRRVGRAFSPATRRVGVRRRAAAPGVKRISVADADRVVVEINKSFELETACGRADRITIVDTEAVGQW